MSLVTALFTIAFAAPVVPSTSAAFNDWQYTNATGMGSKPYTAAGVVKVDGLIYLRVERLSEPMASSSLFSVMAVDSTTGALPVSVAVEATKYIWGAYAVWAIDLGETAPPWTVQIDDSLTGRGFGWEFGSHSVQRLPVRKL
mgnify:CR=1 FL=1